MWCQDDSTGMITPFFFFPLSPEFSAAIDCNLHNESDDNPWPCQKRIQWHQNSPTAGLSATMWHRPKVIPLHFSSPPRGTYMTCCFCCPCHLAISAAQAQSSKYWCEQVYPCLLRYVSNPIVFFLAHNSKVAKDIGWRTSSPHAWTARRLMNGSGAAGVAAPRKQCIIGARGNHAVTHIMSNIYFSKQRYSHPCVP